MPFLINLLVGIALSLASTLIQAIFAQDQKEKVPGVRGSLQTGGDNPLAFLMGFYAAGGQLEYAGTWGNSGDTPNAYYTKVVSFSDLPVNALTGFFVNGERVTLADTPHATRGFPVLEYRVKGKDHLWVKFYDGTQTVADTLLMTVFAGDPDRPWTSDMIGRGIAWAHVTAKVNRELFTGLPEYLFEVEGIKLYDPRQDDTAGGDGDQRLNDPETWTYSNNPIVGIYNVLLGFYYNGDWVYGPQNTTQAQLPYANWAAQMNKCDAIDPATGQKRFQFGLEVLFDEEPEAIIGELLKSCQGRIAPIGGIYKVLVGAPEAPVLAITDDDISISDDQTYEPFPGLEETYNGVTATYPEPEESWQIKEAPSRYDTALELEDNGNRLPFDTFYKAVPYPEQVQNLMEASLLETRRFRKHSFTGLSDWWEYEPLDVFTWTSDRNGYDEKQFLITVLEDLPNGNQVVGSQEIDPSDYDGLDEFDDYETTPIVISRPPAQAILGWAVSPFEMLDDDDEVRRPGILLEYASQQDDVRAVRAQVRVSGQTAVIFDGEVPYDLTITDPLIGSPIVGDFLAPNVLYEVRGKFVPFSGRTTLWSNEDEEGVEGPWLEVLTPNIRLGAKDIEITLDEIADEINQQLNWIKNGVRGAIENLRLVGSILEASDRENAFLRGQLVREVNVRLNDLEAGFIEVIEVALGPGGAIATALSSLYAAMGGNTSEVNVRWEAVAAPSGYSARYAIQAAVNDGSFRAATFMLDVPADPMGKTRIVLDADQTVISTDSGATVQAMFDSEGAIIRDLRVGTIEGPGGASFWNLTTGAFRVSGGT